MLTVNLNFNTVTLCRGWIQVIQPPLCPLQPPLRNILKPNTCNTLKPNEFSPPLVGTAFHRWLQ